MEYGLSRIWIQDTVYWSYDDIQSLQAHHYLMGFKGNIMLSSRKAFGAGLLFDTDDLSNWKWG